MITFIRFMSIAANMAFMVFLGFLIVDEAATLRWVHSVNQLWFFLGAVAIIVLAALLAELYERGKPATSRTGQPAGISPAGKVGEQGGQQRAA
jgi:membrane associated rhomboid family serine protease